MDDAIRPYKLEGAANRFTPEVAQRAVEHSINHQIHMLPGGGIYREQRVMLFGYFILKAAVGLVRVTSRERTAAALRRAAEMIERDRIDGPITDVD